MVALPANLLTDRQMTDALQFPPLHGDGLDIWSPNGRHCLAVGIDHAHPVTIHGTAGYSCAALSHGAHIHVCGNVGWSVAASMSAGWVEIDGHAGEAAACGLHGGLVLVRGRCGRRAAQGMMGGTLICGGDADDLAGFGLQGGRLVIAGSAGDRLGEGMTGGTVYIAGSIKSLGRGAILAELDQAELEMLDRLLAPVSLVAAGAWRKVVAAIPFSPSPVNDPSPVGLWVPLQSPGKGADPEVWPPSGQGCTCRADRRDWSLTALQQADWVQICFLPGPQDGSVPARHADIWGADDLAIKLQEIRQVIGAHIPVVLRMLAGRVEQDLKLAARLGFDAVCLIPGQDGIGLFLGGDDMAFLPANLTRLAVDPWAEGCDLRPHHLDLPHPLLPEGFDETALNAVVLPQNSLDVRGLWQLRQSMPADVAILCRMEPGQSAVDCARWLAMGASALILPDLSGRQDDLLWDLRRIICLCGKTRLTSLELEDLSDPHAASLAALQKKLLSPQSRILLSGALANLTAGSHLPGVRP